MIPRDRSGAVVDGAQEGFSSETVVGAGPAVAPVFILEEINPVAVHRADNEKSGLRVEAGRPEIGRSSLVGRHQNSVSFWLLGRVGNGASQRIDSLGPVDGGERGCQNAFPV